MTSATLSNREVMNWRTLYDQRLTREPSCDCQWRSVFYGRILYFQWRRYRFTWSASTLMRALFNRLTQIEEPTLFAIPLNSSFPTDGLLPANAYRHTPAPGEDYQAQGAFFKDAADDTLYSMCGFAGSSAPINTLLAYNTTSEEWKNVTVSGGSFNFDSRAATLNAISRGQGNGGLGFLTGGWEDLPGMIKFNGSDPANLRWTNETNDNVPLTLEGGMEYIRYGKQGSLITFGGYVSASVFYPKPTNTQAATTRIISRKH